MAASCFASQASQEACTCVSFSVTARRVCESMHWTCWETGIPTGLSRAPRLGRERHGMQLVFENQPVNPRSASSKSCSPNIAMSTADPAFNFRGPPRSLANPVQPHVRNRTRFLDSSFVCKPPAKIFWSARRCFSLRKRRRRSAASGAGSCGTLTRSW